MKLTIVIPTYNRKEILKKCLNALFRQTYPKSEYEIIVVDDGSTDGTEELVKSMMNNFNYRLRYYKLQHRRGPAAARNLGVKYASGKICLFLDDDVEASEWVVEEHVNCHKKFGNNVACLGYTKCHPALEFTPFMKYISNIGPYLDPSSIKDNLEDLPFNYFVTANISVSRTRLLEAGLFDEDFYPAYEDEELGYRLKQRGLKIIFGHKAVAYHSHPIDLNKYCKRQFNVGRAVLIFYRKHPEIKKFEEMVKNKDGTIVVLKSNRSKIEKLKEITKCMLSNKLTIFLLKKLITFFISIRLKIGYRFCFNLVARYYLVKGLLAEENKEKRR